MYCDIIDTNTPTSFCSNNIQYHGFKQTNNKHNNKHKETNIKKQTQTTKITTR